MIRVTRQSTRSSTHRISLFRSLVLACGFLFLLLSGSGRRVGKGRRRARTLHTHIHTCVVYARAHTHIHKTGFRAILRWQYLDRATDIFRSIPSVADLPAAEMAWLASSETWGAQRRLVGERRELISRQKINSPKCDAQLSFLYATFFDLPVGFHLRVVGTGVEELYV